MSVEESRVLIVDDNTSLSQCLVELLNGFDIKASYVDDAESCLKEVSKTLPEVVVMDSALPGMQGEDAIRILKSQNAEMKFIGMSAKDHERDMMEAGADLFLAKPFEFPELVDAIDQVLTQKFSLPEPPAGKKWFLPFKRPKK